MMVLTELSLNASLAELLAARARRATTSRLMIDIIGGALMVAAALLFKPAGWSVLGSAAGCFFAYGCWALVGRVERDIYDAPRRARAWDALGVACATVGVFSFIALLLTAVGHAFGRVIS
jgi:hypothetical protein